MSTKLEIPGDENTSSIFFIGNKLGYLDGEFRCLVEDTDIVSISDLKSALIRCGWMSADHDVYDIKNGILKRKVIQENTDIYETNLIPIYYTSDIEGNGKREKEFTSLSGKFSNPAIINQEDGSIDQDAIDTYNAELDSFLTLYNDYIMTKEDNLGEYNRLVSTRDILGNKSEICLLCPKDGSYTNIVNLNSSISSDEESRTPVQIRVGVAYSKGSRVYSRDITVPTELQDKYIVSKQNDFTLELSDGCLRVFPESQDVTECVINYCFLTYEYLI